MSIITNNTLFNFTSIGYSGQKPSDQDYPEELRKPKLTPQEPETYIEMCKRYVWTVLPLMTLVKPVGSVVTVVSEMAKIAKSVDMMVKIRTLRTVSYNAFQTALSAGMIATTVIEPFSPLVRRLFTGIQLLSLAHQTALSVYRYSDNNNDYQSCKLVTSIVNNITAMLSLISQNPFFRFVFFVLQGFTAVLHATKQVDKKRYLAASVDAIMASVRFVQAYQMQRANAMQKMASQQPNPPKTQKMTSQSPPSLLTKILRFIHIDPREKIKDQLTEQEEIIREFYGEDYLYFKRNGHEEKFLILTAEADHNNALNPLYIVSLIDQLSQRFDVKFRTISHIEDIPKEIQNATQFGPVTGLMLNAHGNSSGIRISYDLNGRLTNQTISPDLFSGLDPRCVIALRSCSVANDPNFGVAYRVANASLRVTFAPDDISSGITLKQLDPLEFSFESYEIPVKTKKIQPLKEDPWKIQPPESDSFFTFLKSLFTSKQETISVQNN
jgi:hypothetical protein